MKAMKEPRPPVSAAKILERRKAIMEYAEANAGTEFDIDPACQAAGIEELMATDEKDLRAGMPAARSSLSNP
jgi:hypothetical protein